MINLTKGAPSISLDKVSRFGVTASWPAVTDYDLGAEILYKDGRTESLATFGAFGMKPMLVSHNGTVVLRGDAGRGAGSAEEIMDVEWDDDIAEIAPWVYSAQSNGSGSFRRHQVTTRVNVGEGVQIKAENASSNDGVYTLVPGLIRFKDGKIEVEYAEFYSSPGSEDRPKYSRGVLGKQRLVMNGPRNKYK